MFMMFMRRVTCACTNLQLSELLNRLIMLTENSIIGSEDAGVAAAWWDEFLLKCKDFTETVVIKNVMSDPECDDMAEMALSAVREICNRQTCEYDFRFYLGTESM